VLIWRYLKAPDHRKTPVAASPSSLSVVADVVQAMDELGAELAAADSVGLLNASHNYRGRPVLADHHGLSVRVPADASYLSGIDRASSGRPRRSVPALASGSGM
jgi:hypothetical protein